MSKTKQELFADHFAAFKNNNDSSELDKAIAYLPFVLDSQKNKFRDLLSEKGVAAAITGSYLGTNYITALISKGVDVQTPSIVNSSLVSTSSMSASSSANTSYSLPFTHRVPYSSFSEQKSTEHIFVDSKITEFSKIWIEVETGKTELTEEVKKNLVELGKTIDDFGHKKNAYGRQEHTTYAFQFIEALEGFLNGEIIGGKGSGQKISTKVGIKEAFEYNSTEVNLLAPVLMKAIGEERKNQQTATPSVKLTDPQVPTSAQKREHQI